MKLRDTKRESVLFNDAVNFKIRVTSVVDELMMYVGFGGMSLTGANTHSEISLLHCY